MKEKEVCESCGLGQYASTNICLTSFPAQYIKVCTHCFHKKTYRDYFPEYQQFNHSILNTPKVTC